MDRAKTAPMAIRPSLHGTYRADGTATFTTATELSLPLINSYSFENTNGSNHELVTAVQSAKIERKKTESELQLLASRISLLRTEEQKALQKITETKARAKELLEIKKQKEELTQLKLSKLVGKEVLVKNAQQKAAIERENRHRKLLISKKLHNDNKKATVDELRHTSKQIEEQLEYQRQVVDQDRRQKAEDIRKNRENLRLIREKEKIEREKKIRLEYVSKLEDENKKRQEAHNLIELLENEERELINRLKRTNELQKTAYNILKNSLEK
jgi:hypothetical protein